MEPGSGWTKGDGGATEATPLRPRDLPAARLNVSTNVVLLFRLNELKDLCHVNFILACLTLLYLSVNVFACPRLNESIFWKTPFESRRASPPLVARPRWRAHSRPHLFLRPRARAEALIF